MLRDTYLNLNSLPVRKAVCFVVNEAGRKHKKPDLEAVTVKEIRFDNRRHMLTLRDKDVYCYDRHLHWPRKVDHTTAA